MRFDHLFIYRQVFELKKGVGDYGGDLRKILKILGCPYSNLRTAGSDANFILRALLHFAAKSARGHQSNFQDEAVLARLLELQEIGYPTISVVHYLIGS